MDISAEIRKIPFVTRFLCLATLGVTGAMKIGILSGYWAFFHPDLAFKRFQLWRMYTSLLVGKSSLSFIFELLMLYRTTYEIESKSYSHRSSDLAYQLLWVAPAIIGATLPLNSFYSGKALLLALVYFYSRLAPTDGITSIMGIISVPIKYQPYIMIGFDLFAAGKDEAMLDIAGCVVGHIWWWTVWGSDSSGRGTLSTYAKAPEWLRRWMGERGPRPRVDGERPIGGGVYVTPPPRYATSGSSPSTATATTGHRWGGGRRLGNS